MTPDCFPSRDGIRAHQFRELRKLLAAVATGNRFYGPRLQQAGLSGEQAIMAAFEDNAKDVARVGGG